MRKNCMQAMLILALIHQVGGAAGGSDFPEWIHELRAVAVKTFRVEIDASNVKLPDNLEEGKHFVFCLKGNGSLAETPEPFETMHRMFSTNGWRSIKRYQADGHGSTSFAYEKSDRVCNIFISVDSSDDDEETGHIPSEYRFEIYCR